VTAVLTLTTATTYRTRLDRVRQAMGEQGVDVLMLSVGHDLPYLTGYLAMPLERLTMLVVPAKEEPTLVVQASEPLSRDDSSTGLESP